MDGAPGAHCRLGALLSALFPCSSIVNVPGESTLRRDFLRLQQENKERSEALRRQQLLQEQQLREQEEYKRQLLAERQKRIEQQKEQRRRLEEVGAERGRQFSGHPGGGPPAAGQGVPARGRWAGLPQLHPTPCSQGHRAPAGGQLGFDLISLPLLALGSMFVDP